jgi:hypothetical protein
MLGIEPTLQEPAFSNFNIVCEVQKAPRPFQLPNVRYRNLILLHRSLHTSSTLRLTFR